MIKIVIPGRLPGLNEYIRECRKNQYAGGKMKKDDETRISWHINHQARDVKIDEPVRMVYRWHEVNRRRDLDNISSYGRKVIQDALVACEVLPDDGWNNITGFEDYFYIDKKNPRIEVEIYEEAENETD